MPSDRNDEQGTDPGDHNPERRKQETADQHHRNQEGRLPSPVGNRGSRQENQLFGRKCGRL